MKKKQGIVERTFNCLWRMLKKPLLFVCCVCLSIFLLLGTNVKVDFSLDRVKDKIESSFFSKLVDRLPFGDLIKGIF